MYRLRTVMETITGFFGLGLYILNSIIWVIITIIPSPLCYLLPVKDWRKRCRILLESLPSYWIEGNTLIQRLTIPNTRWIAKYKSHASFNALTFDSWYLLMSNHQSWVDILVLQRLFNRRIPLLKFFMKSELLWRLPLLTWVCWLLGFPFVSRYTHQQLLQTPALKMLNLQNTLRICENYKDFPTVVANFVEGRRFTPLLHERQASPYQHLLCPRSGGFALSLAALSDRAPKILNVTILYSTPKVSFWDFLCGRIQQITVYTEILPMRMDLVGDYMHDKSFQLRFQEWLNQIWGRKDALIQTRGANHEWLSHEV
jgi:1-acyl-sn-glycerol-3-phosphate acyltransferase